MRLDVRRRAKAQAPLLSVLAIVFAVFLYMALTPSHWRRASAMIAVAMLLAGVLRLVLPAPLAGLLAARGRWWDSFCYLALGAAILIIDLRLQA